MAHRARFAAAMTAATRRLPFGLSRVVAPSLLGYLLINLCTFFIDLALLAVFHAGLRWPLPVSVTLSYGAASLISYLLNRVLNFRSRAAVGAQLPVFVAVSAGNYLVFVLGLTDGLAALGVYFELARVIAALCEACYLYCMMRWVVFRDTRRPGTADGAAAAGGAGERAAAAPGRARAARLEALGNTSGGPDS